MADQVLKVKFDLQEQNEMKQTTYLAALVFCAAWGCGPSAPPTTTKDYSAYLALPLETRQEAAHATEAFETAAGLDVQLFAGEPMVINPTNIAVDEKGRVWVCESYNYAVPEAEQRESGGRIIILTDTDQDGRADQRQVYYQGEDVHLALGINKLGNRLFVSRSPNLLVFTDLDGDDIPDQKDTLFTGMGRPGDHSAHALVFGPDGRFYFNYGNAGQKVLYPDGNPVIDRYSGQEVRSDGKPYYGGMVFRCDPDGGSFEVLAHNFRNNYEVGIDAYGSIWQSDNDDDGNKSARINYILEYGNYGFQDEYTGAHWSAVRTGMHDSIPMRHWHQNDPGVVPNLLITGAGSPAGITVYEGHLLPEIFQGQLIHADAGPNVVRAYPVQEQGAGYRATMEPLLHSLHDQWSRPVDVAVAPDGSLMIADWYDPIVGGAAAGDHEKGRIFRIAPPGIPYQCPPTDFSTIEGAIAGLQLPNESARYLAWQSLHEAGTVAEPALLRLWQGKEQRLRARALWLLGQIPGKGPQYVQAALQDPSTDLRITGIRLARLLELDLIPVVKQLLHDPHPRVRAELAIALRYTDAPEAATLWAALATQHDGRDRWYLEALGIGAERHWAGYFQAWQQLAAEHWNSPAGRDIVWRSRAEAAAPLLAELIADPNIPAAERLRYFRAFDFHRGTYKNGPLLQLLDTPHPEQVLIQAQVLQQLDKNGLEISATLQEALNNTLTAVAGTWQFVELVAKFDLRDQQAQLLRLAAQARENDAGTAAARLLTDPATFNALPLIRKRIYENEADGPGLIHAIRSTGRQETFQLLQEVVLASQLSLPLRKVAIQALAQSWTGEDYLLKCVQDPAFPEALKPQAGSVLFSVYRTSIHEEAAKYLPPPGNIRQEELPPIRVLAATLGNAQRGQAIFQNQCRICHQIDQYGIAFGPDLSQIGGKLDKEGLYRAILYPNEGVSYGYETYKLNLRSGGVVLGLITSETDDALTLKSMGGQLQRYPKTDIAGKELMDNSMMPNLSLAMEQEELIDLVEYLAGLKLQ